MRGAPQCLSLVPPLFLYISQSLFPSNVPPASSPAKWNRDQSLYARSSSVSCYWEPSCRKVVGERERKKEKASEDLSGKNERNWKKKREPNDGFEVPQRSPNLIQNPLKETNYKRESISGYRWVTHKFSSPDCPAPIRPEGKKNGSNSGACGHARHRCKE